MKRLTKILALILALFVILPAAVSAGANPDQIIGGINNGVGNYVVSANDNYFGIMPGHSSCDDGFGTSNPIGLARMGAAWQSGMSSLPLFEMLAYDRTTGAFNPGKLISLTPSVDGSILKYDFPDNYGFSYDPSKQSTSDAFYAHPSEKYTPVVSFTAPTDGVYTWSLTFKRQTAANVAVDSNHPLTNSVNGTQLKYYKNHEQIRRFVINDASARTLTVTATLNRGDVIYLEFPFTVISALTASPLAILRSISISIIPDALTLSMTMQVRSPFSPLHSCPTFIPTRTSCLTRISLFTERS